MDIAALLASASNPEAIFDELCRRNFVSFVIRAFPFLNGGAELQPNWSIDAIAYALEQVASGRCTRQIICLPPRHLKSQMTSVMWVAWRLGHDPSHNFVCVSYSNELSAKHARDCRALLHAPWYRRMFPATHLDPNRSAVHDFETTAGGGRLATSITGTLTGRGGDTIIIDDPIKPDDAYSDTLRDGVNDWFSTTLASRLNDKARGAILLVMQRLHPFDLVGKLEEAGVWSQLSLPVIAESDQSIPLPRGCWQHRKEGDVLHPERESRADLELIRQTMGSTVFSAQYLQRPVPLEGNLVKGDWLCTFEPGDYPTGLGTRVVQSWDTATEDGALNDYSVCVTAVVHKGRVYVVDVFRKKVDFPTLKREAISKARDLKANALLIEDQSSGRQLIQALRSEGPTGVPRPIARTPDRNKVSRLAGVSAMIEAGQLLLPREASWLAEFKHELLAFPSVRYDDQVDALTQLMLWVRSGYQKTDTVAAPIFFYASD